MSLPLHPIHAKTENGRRRRDPDCWYYQEKDGLHVVAAPSTAVNPCIYVIPLREIRAYLKRMDAESED